jgi:hypothetical protein
MSAVSNTFQNTTDILTKLNVDVDVKSKDDAEATSDYDFRRVCYQGNGDKTMAAAHAQIF